MNMVRLRTVAFGHGLAESVTESPVPQRPRVGRRDLKDGLSVIVRAKYTLQSGMHRLSPAPSLSVSWLERCYLLMAP